MSLLLMLFLLLFSTIPAFAQAPTCEEQVALLQGYVTELANQRGSLESRLIMTQAELKKRQDTPPAAAHPDAEARMKQIDAEKERVKKQKEQSLKSAP